ncbi:TetR family transcriptional regulator [Actinocrispum wychmicini]|uniref:TetR family transcriptional regulator n=1 Tax=Actinocrispum wychmicini TaxID=1213861 RepID=A0A4R2JU31_9PSEU|nr:TetR family transcriptional regulator [Actinocrispum wychmicini]
MTDAAIVTLARSGMRGLTHRAVDHAADVAEGSTSYYFRTREALLVATMERLAELSTADIAAVRGTDLEAVTALLHHWLTHARDRMVARFELTLEATRRPALRAALTSAGGQFRAMAHRLLAEAGVPDARRRAANLVAHIDGLLFDQLAGAGPRRSRTDLRDALRPLFEAALTPGRADAAGSG